MNPEHKMKSDETPTSVARHIVEGMFGIMDEKHHFHNQNGQIPSSDLDDFMRNWITYLNARDFSLARINDKNRDFILGQLNSMEAIVNEKCAEARKDPAVWEALMKAVKFLSDIGKPLPEPLAELAVETMRGETKAPTIKGRRANADRDLVIQMAVLEIIRRFPDIAPTRNDATRGRQSACDFVAGVLAENGIVLGVRSVEKVWEKVSVRVRKNVR